MNPNLEPSSILSRALAAHFVDEPFPHLVLTEALDPAIFEELAASFPSEEVLLDGRPARDTWYDYPACKVLADSRVGPA